MRAWVAEFIVGFLAGLQAADAPGLTLSDTKKSIANYAERGDLCRYVGRWQMGDALVDGGKTDSRAPDPKSGEAVVRLEWLKVSADRRQADTIASGLSRQAMNIRFDSCVSNSFRVVVGPYHPQEGAIHVACAYRQYQGNFFVERLMVPDPGASV